MRWHSHAIWLMVLAVGCSPRVDRVPIRDSTVTPAVSVAAAALPDSDLIVVKGPTLIVFFRGAYTAADSGGANAEALGDVEYHLGSARPALDSLGVTIEERYGEHIEYVLDGVRSRFTPAADSGRAAYLFLAPRAANYVHYGLLTDIELRSEARSRFNVPAWHDTSPHRAGFVGSAGHRIRYLDWGGDGPPLVLLHGWNSNAHVFDDIAPRLVDDFHVVALTLPGFGDSDAPDSAYSLNSAADAVVGALDSLHITRASLAGHSFGGWILSRIATRYPRRVNRLVYLDAAFDLRRSDSIVALRPLQRPSTKGLATQADVMVWLRRNFYGMWSPALEAEYRGRSVEEEQRAPLLRRLVADAQGSPDEWRNIKAPVLGICAIATVASEFPWLSPGDSGFAAARSYVEAVRRPFQHAECARFQRTVPQAKTVELPGHHYVFLAHRDTVVSAVRQFLLQPTSGR